MQKEERRLRVGILGCGPIAQIAHFDAVRKARNADLHALCDLAPDLRERMALLHQPRRVHDSLEAMLADPELEAVIIGVADQFHVTLAEQVLRAGKHVLVEKPLGVTIEECEGLRDTLRAAGVVFQVGNNRRFDPGVAFARTFAREEMGDLLALKAWYCDSTFRYTMTDNLQPLVQQSARARRPEGNPKADTRRYFMLTHGSHLVDTARFLGGDIVSVRARLQEAHDAYTWFVEATCANGALGHLDLTIPLRGDFEEGFRLYGQHGSIQGRVHLPWFHKSAEVECFSIRDRQYRRPLGEDAHSYKLQVEGFADTILHGQPQHGATLEDGIAAMRAMVAIARSVERGETVQLKEVTGAV